MDDNNVPASSGLTTRREFIKKASTAAAVVATTNLFKTPVYGQSQAPSPGRVIGANDRILVGYIGVGGLGLAHVNSQKKFASDNNIAQIAVCDLSKHRVAGIFQAPSAPIAKGLRTITASCLKTRICDAP